MENENSESGGNSEGKEEYLRIRVKGMEKYLTAYKNRYKNSERDADFKGEGVLVWINETDPERVKGEDLGKYGQGSQGSENRPGSNGFSQGQASQAQGSQRKAPVEEKMNVPVERPFGDRPRSTSRNW